MTQYQLDPSPPPRNGPRTWLAGILVGLLLLIGLSSLAFLPRLELTFGPTATPTATPRPQATATADFGATRVAQDLTAQAVGPAFIDLGLTPTPAGVTLYDPTLVPPPSPSETDGLTEATPADQAPTVPAENISANVGDIDTVGPDTSMPATATPAVESPLGGPAAAGNATMTVNLPMAAAPEPISPASPPTTVPTATPLASPTPTIPTATPTAVPITPSPTFSPTPSPPPYRVDSLLAKVTRPEIERRRAPIADIDTESDKTWAVDQEIRLLGRTASGEWVYGEQNGERGWLRQYHLQFLDNQAPNSAPDDFDPNDVRWLSEQTWPADIEPLPIPTAMPVLDFPQANRDRANQARVAQLPSTNYVPAWPNGYYEAADAFSSPVSVADDTVAVANADRHVYAVNRTSGTQKWRMAVDNPVTKALAIQDDTIYAVDEKGLVYAVSQSGRRWATATDMEPTAGVVVAADRVIVVGRTNGGKQLVLLNRNNGEIIDTFTEGGIDFMRPAVGDQMIYVAGSRIWALDLYHSPPDDDGNTATQTWRALWSFPLENNAQSSSAPLYAWPGQRALAEIYVGAADGRVYLLDANTGQRLEWYEGGRPVTALALDDRYLYAVGPNADFSGGILRVYARDTRDFLWEANLTTLPVSGPITDGQQVLVFLENGSILAFESSTGVERARAFIPSTLRGGAVSAPYLFAAGSNNKVYAIEGLD